MNVCPFGRDIHIEISRLTTFDKEHADGRIITANAKIKKRDRVRFENGRHFSL